MDGRARVRLGQHERLVVARERERLASGASCTRVAGGPRRIPRPESARSARRPSSDELVLAVAEEREVVVREPRKEALRLLELVVGDRAAGCSASSSISAFGASASRASPRRPRAPRARTRSTSARSFASELGVGLARDLGVEDRLGDRAFAVGARLDDVDQLAVRVAPHARPRDGSRGRSSARARPAPSSPSRRGTACRR